jgi:hypothetical protein
MRFATTCCVWLCVAAAVDCAPSVNRTGSAPSPSQFTELWIDPGSAPRNLVNGPASPATTRPTSDRRYDILSRDTAGFSITYRVRDAEGDQWHVKIGPESQTEVVASRIVWAVGNHQWRDAFTAGNFTAQQTDRSVARIREKIAEGLEQR